jgi:hypothetical protein
MNHVVYCYFYGTKEKKIEKKWNRAFFFGKSMSHATH